MTISELVRSLSDHCQQQVNGRHVLAINDSSEINLQAHAGRLKFKSLGVVGNNQDVGFFLHPTLILDAQSGFPLGLSHVQLWTREAGHKTKKERNYQKLPIEDKESFKWIDSAQSSFSVSPRRWCGCGDAYWRLALTISMKLGLEFPMAITICWSGFAKIVDCITNLILCMLFWVSKAFREPIL